MPESVAPMPLPLHSRADGQRIRIISERRISWKRLEGNPNRSANGSSSCERYSGRRIEWNTSRGGRRPRKQQKRLRGRSAWLNGPPRLSGGQDFRDWNSVLDRKSVV